MWYITRNRVEYWSIKKDNANNAISCYEKDNVILYQLKWNGGFGLVVWSWGGPWFLTYFPSLFDNRFSSKKINTFFKIFQNANGSNFVGCVSCAGSPHMFQQPRCKGLPGRVACVLLASNCIELRWDARQGLDLAFRTGTLGLAHASHT